MATIRNFGALAELSDQVGKAGSCGAEVGVDFRPSCRSRTKNILRAFAVREVFRVSEGVERCTAFDSSSIALPGTVVVHREDLEKYFPVFFWIVRRGHQHAEDSCADEDQRLTSPPFAETGKRLTGSRLALLVGLRGETGNGKLGFDEGGHGHELVGLKLSEVEERQTWEALEIPIERDEPTSCGDSESGEVGIRPEAMKHGIAEREPGEMQISVRRLGKKTDLRNGEIATVDMPCLFMGQRPAQHARLGAEAQKSEHGDPTKGRLSANLLIPIVTGREVMRVVFIDEGEPYVDIGQVNHLSVFG